MDILEEAFTEAFKKIWREYTYPTDMEMFKALAGSDISFPTFDEHWNKYGVPALAKSLKESLGEIDEKDQEKRNGQGR